MLLQTALRVLPALPDGPAEPIYALALPGVLSYVFDDLTRIRGGPPRIDVLSLEGAGTSCGR